MQGKTQYKIILPKLKPRLHEQFLFKNKRLETGIYGWHQKIANFMYCLFYADNFLYVTTLFAT